MTNKMTNRRNSIISKKQYQDGIRLGTVMHIYGRYPQNGVHFDCGKNTIVYVMKGSGMISSADQRTAVSAGSIMHLKNCVRYFLKGQFSIYVMHI